MAIAYLAKDHAIASELVEKHKAYNSLGRFLDPPGKWGENTVCLAIRSLHHLTVTEHHVECLVRNTAFEKLVKLLLRAQNNQIIEWLLLILSRVFCFIKDSKSITYWIVSKEMNVELARYNASFYMFFSKHNNLLKF